MSPRDAFFDLFFLIPLVLVPGLIYLLVMAAMPKRRGAGGSARVQGRPQREPEALEPKGPDIPGPAGALAVGYDNDDFSR